jgi:hypothetical protein
MISRRKTPTLAKKIRNIKRKIKDETEEAESKAYEAESEARELRKAMVAMRENGAKTNKLHNPNSKIGEMATKAIEADTRARYYKDVAKSVWEKNSLCLNELGLGELS